MISAIIIFLIVLSVLVLVHEAGHFFTAIWTGAKVEEFGVGFPPRAWSWVRKGIRYSINWIPLGGFVRIKGESGQDRQDPDSFANKPAWKRLIVLAAGVVMNIVLAAFLLSFGALIGTPQVIDPPELSAKAIVRDQAIRVIEVAPGSAAELSGVAAGDELVSIDGQVFASADLAREYIGTHLDQAMALEIVRGAETLAYTVTPTALPEADGQKMLGVGLVETGIVSYPWYLAPLQGIMSTMILTHDIALAFWDLLFGLVTRAEVAVELSGPVGIAVMTGEVAKMGLAYLIQFAAILSINLAIINILPFPALDGGRILFLLVEKLRGKPVSAQVEGWVHAAGFALLMVLVVLVTYQDVVRSFL